MKIAYDYQIFAAQKFGGISRYFDQITGSLATTDDVKIIAPLHKNHYLSAGNHQHVWGRYCTHSKLQPRIRNLVNKVAYNGYLAAWQPNVVHETYYSEKPTARFSLPTVLTVYDMIHERFPTSFAADDTASERKRAAVARADHILCISESTRQDLIRLFSVPPEKATTVLLGADFPLKTHKESLHTRPYLLFVGQRGGYKNFIGMLTAITNRPALKNHFDVVAFGGPPFNRDELNSINKLGFSHEQVTHTSGSDDLLSAYYQHAAAMVYPSHYEGFGLPPLEAMANGCPVVSSNSSSMPEVSLDAAEFFDPNDVDEMASAIDTVVSNNQRRAELIRLGTIRARHLSWERCATETRKIYAQVAV